MLEPAQRDERSHRNESLLVAPTEKPTQQQRPCAVKNKMNKYIYFLKKLVFWEFSMM